MLPKMKDPATFELVRRCHRELSRSQMIHCSILFYGYSLAIGSDVCGQKWLQHTSSEKMQESGHIEGIDVLLFFATLITVSF